MRRVILLLSVVVVVRLQAAAQADPNVTASYWPIEHGYRLDFVAYADPMWGFFQWGLFTTAFADLAFPANWQGGVGVRETIWYSPRREYDVVAGGVLRGCAASLAERPGPMGYYILGDTSYYGTVIPVLIPEPCSALALLGGLAGLGGVMLRRREG